ncbi:probable ubiquinol--cytochrome-c reductase [Phialocephala subalpina]|uniref:Cytochrome b-c1 complex subunit 7 n=1 Tax=Phialocephala subalpina TaxID=576137 RepID=A0A1L7X3W0_9HELO|nr:probable ubiquinol--cytochrome-c reductase [Phialocephala subalpina]
MSQPSLVNFIVKRPWLSKFMKPLSNWYANAAGYRKLGLKADDLIPEESETVLLALKRLPPKEAYDRVFRLRRAFQCSLAHQLLPKEQHTKPDEDVEYLSPIIRQIEAEAKERDDLESLSLNKRK